MTSLSPFWKTMPSGRAFDFVNPCPEMVTLDDIVHVLARTNRWGGNIEPVSYSVAQHSLVTASACATVDARPYALLHDAAEAYIGDIPTPFKLWLNHAGADVVALERRILLDAVFPAFGLPRGSARVVQDVHNADAIALATEHRDIVAGRHPDFTPEATPLRTRIRFKPVAKVEEEFKTALLGALQPFGKVA